MTEADTAVRVTMVKKKLASGEPCKKCGQAEDLLRRRELWDEIDEVIWADETDPSSTGMQLAKKHSIETAPFFLVEEGGVTTAYPSVVKVAQDVLSRKKSGEEKVNKGVSGARWPREDVLKEALTWEARPAVELVAHVLDKLGERCAIAFSGAEDVALIDMAVKSGKKFSVFSLDTGRLHPETYRFIETFR